MAKDKNAMNRERWERRQQRSREPRPSQQRREPTPSQSVEADEDSSRTTEEITFESRPVGGLTPLPGYWRMRDGILIRIDEMSDNHLTNAIRMLENMDRPVPALDTLRAEVIRRRITSTPQEDEINRQRTRDEINRRIREQELQHQQRDQERQIWEQERHRREQERSVRAGMMRQTGIMTGVFLPGLERSPTMERPLRPQVVGLHASVETAEILGIAPGSTYYVNLLSRKIFITDRMTPENLVVDIDHTTPDTISVRVSRENDPPPTVPRLARRIKK